MKKFALFILLFLTGWSNAQSVNEFRYVVIPTRFELQSEPNQYRLNTLSKKYLTEAGFEAVHESLMTDDQVNRRCDNLFIDIVKVKSLLTIKIKVVFRDCRNAVIFESKEGNSKEKSYEKGYQEALAKAFESVKELQYTYTGKKQDVTPEPQPVAVSKPVVPAAATPIATTPVVPSDTTLKPSYTVEALASGYLIIDSNTSKIALKILKTSDPKIYTASRNGDSGVFLNKNGKWFFEYYRNGTLYSEEFSVDYTF
ncbi:MULTISPECIES: hypothetical protein [unclassified Flavobacterium]|uniref:hypothetical protein n=1 Tax=unclassified Flavobacterium TaxID=196869 RepID=UPI001F140A58|nr:MULTISPECIES: hypothetical protein [unclassified Flavobacterium]UMY66962.1 hypothetical protein MKO97_06165 [Flavobacterium sp. HJ-32-4]